VLEGGTAVLAAATRHAVAQFVPGMEPSSKVVAKAVKVGRAQRLSLHAQEDVQTT
jgi:hypothetical protein